MKSIKTYILGFIVLGSLLFAGCTEDFEEINKNPNQCEEPVPSALFAYAVRQLAYDNYDVWYMLRQSALCSQQWCQKNYTSEDRYGFRTGVLNTFFRDNYVTLNNFQKIIDINTDETTKEKMRSTYGSNEMQIAICEIMKCWTFHLLVDQFGPIPYTDALDINVSQPAYNSEKEVYDALISKLKECREILVNDTTAHNPGYGTGDVVYRGDLSKWIKFANSLRLRLALRASAADESYLEEAKSAIADGCFESCEDDATCPFIGPGAPNEAPLYAGYFTEGRNDFTYTHRFIEMLKGNNDRNFVNPFPKIIDPRFYIYTGCSDTARQGLFYGTPDNLNKAIWKYWSGEEINQAINLWDNYPSPLHATHPSTFLDYPTVCFMKSEVNGWSSDDFKEGISASMEQWGVSPAASSEYIDKIMPLFNAATPEGKKEMVITQKYIHLLTQSHEAWAEYRRTGYPKSLVIPGDTTGIITMPKKIDENTFIDTTYVIVFETMRKETEVVTRFVYPNSEKTTNSENLQDAINLLGDDTYNTHLWWDKD